MDKLCFSLSVFPFCIVNIYIQRLSIIKIFAFEAIPLTTALIFQSIRLLRPATHHRIAECHQYELHLYSDILLTLASAKPLKPYSVFITAIVWYQYMKVKMRINRRSVSQRCKFTIAASSSSAPASSGNSAIVYASNSMP